MDLCNIDTIRAVLRRHGFHFSKSLGQNFLTEAWVPARIAESCGVNETSCALEVGPGMGCLTEQLSKRASQVCSIELDRALFPVLEETLADCSNVEIVQGDVLKCDLAGICQEKFGEKPVYACANLPYYITTPAITAMLESKAFSAITVMVQKATQITAHFLFILLTMHRQRFCLMCRAIALCLSRKWILRSFVSCRVSSRLYRSAMKSCCLR